MLFEFKITEIHVLRLVPVIRAARGPGCRPLACVPGATVLLWSSLAKFYVRWQVVHMFSLLFPEHFLFEFCKCVEK